PCGAGRQSAVGRDRPALPARPALTSFSLYDPIMAIKASSSKQIDALVADLASANAIKREAAIARLTVLGARAVERVAALAAAPSAPAARAAAFRALEGIADPRGLEPARRAIAD